MKDGKDARGCRQVMVGRLPGVVGLGGWYVAVRRAGSDEREGLLASGGWLRHRMCLCVGG